jgi:hypothetical protein
MDELFTMRSIGSKIRCSVFGSGLVSSLIIRNWVASERIHSGYGLSILDIAWRWQGYICIDFDANFSIS